MKKKKLKSLPDRAWFTRSPRKKAAGYELNTLIKESKKAVFTSIKSKKTYVIDWNEVVYWDGGRIV